jgi:hypothetical protein
MSATVEYTELPDLQPIKPQRRRRGNPPGVGRKFGSLNKVTSTIKEGVISGLAAQGYDGDGLGGFPGFIRFLAEQHPKAAARLVERLLPLNIHGEVNSAPVAVVQVTSIPSGTFISKNAAVQTEPLTIDATPEPASDPSTTP